MTMTVSRFAPKSFPSLPDIAGVTLVAGSAGIKKDHADDVLLVGLAPGSQAAGVFTQSATAAAPVDWCRDILSGRDARALVVNSGNANAFTGAPGAAVVDSVATHTAQLFDCRREEIYIASTGVIGEPLNDSKINASLSRLAPSLRPGDWLSAARSIMTTDTYPKGAMSTCRIDDQVVSIAGVAKGSGMIMPDMATMLCFVFTDARVSQSVLQQMLIEGVATSFNNITVDSDTSTNDTVLVFASAQAQHRELDDKNDPRIAGFAAALNAVLLDLALQVVKDGEGISKLITVNVSGAESAADAHQIAMTVGNSPLVKTAIAGEDANWGRIVMAVGKSAARVDKSKLGVSIGGIALAAAGTPVVLADTGPIDSYMQNDEIVIDIDIGLGNARSRIWASDLTHGYVSINGDYRS